MTFDAHLALSPTEAARFLVHLILRLKRSIGQLTKRSQPKHGSASMQPAATDRPACKRSLDPYARNTKREFGASMRFNAFGDIVLRFWAKFKKPAQRSPRSDLVPWT